MGQCGWDMGGTRGTPAGGMLGGVGFNFLFIYRIPSWENRESWQEQQGRGWSLLPVLPDPCPLLEITLMLILLMIIVMITGNAAGLAPGQPPGHGPGRDPASAPGSCGWAAPDVERTAHLGRERCRSGKWGGSGSHRSSHPAPEHPSIPPPRSHPSHSRAAILPGTAIPTHSIHPISPAPPACPGSILPWSIHPSCPGSSIPPALDHPSHARVSLLPWSIHSALDPSCPRSSIPPWSITPLQSIPPAPEHLF